MTHARIARARHGSSEDKTARDVLANIAVMRKAIDLGATAKHVSVDAIKSIHRELLPEIQVEAAVLAARASPRGCHAAGTAQPTVLPATVRGPGFIS